MILGLIDIEANYLVLKAYQYTTLSSVQVSAVCVCVCVCVRVCNCVHPHFPDVS